MLEFIIIVNHSFPMPNFWIYIIYCSNAAYYTGFTIDLHRRYQAHVKGTAAKFTRSFRPLYLAGAWPIYGSKGQALQIERLIKKLNKKEKQRIIDNPALLVTLVHEYLRWELEL
jgi:putative endonuclease